jgi:hypothetical protein
MRRLFSLFMILALGSAFAFAVPAGDSLKTASLQTVRATHARSHRHKAHKAGKHRAPRHRHYRSV